MTEICIEIKEYRERNKNLRSCIKDQMGETPSPRVAAFFSLISFLLPKPTGSSTSFLFFANASTRRIFPPQLSRDIYTYIYITHTLDGRSRVKGERPRDFLGRRTHAQRCLEHNQERGRWPMLVPHTSEIEGRRRTPSVLHTTSTFLYFNTNI